MLLSQIFHNRYTLHFHSSYHMQISVFVFCFWKFGVDSQAGNPEDKNRKLDLFHVIQQAHDRGLPDSQAYNADRRPRTVLEYNDEAYLVQVTISAYRIEELFNLKVDSLMNWSFTKYHEMQKKIWNCSTLLGMFSSMPRLFLTINSPKWSEALICESSISPLARPIGILHSRESTRSLF